MPTAEQIQAFNNNPTIRELATYPYWTISNADKKPVNIGAAIDRGFDLTYCKLYTDDDPNAKMALDIFTDDSRIVNTNRALRVNAQLMGIFVLDIENTTPLPQVQALLQLPIQYLEYSKHNGYHAIVKLYDDILADPKYAKMLKSVEQKFGQNGPHSGIEVLFNRHFVTFTRKTISLPSKYQDPKFLEQAHQAERNFFDFLLKIHPHAGKTIKADFKTSEEMPEEIKNHIETFEKATKIISKLDEYDISQNTNNDHPNGDPSNYDYAIAIRVANQVIQYMSLDKYAKNSSFNLVQMFGTPQKPNMNNITWLTFAVTQEYLYATYEKNGKYHDIEPDRIERKYETMRDGKPYIMHICESAIQWLKEHGTFQQYIMPGIGKDHTNDDQSHTTVTPKHSFNVSDFGL